MLEWFLLIICKEHTLRRCRPLLKRNRPTLCFFTEIRRSADAQYWTVALSNWQKQQPEVYFIKKAILRGFAIFTGKHPCWSLFFIKLQTFGPATSLKRDSYTPVFLLQNFEEHLFSGISESSNVIIRPIVNFLFFFYKKILHTHQKHKTTYNKQKIKNTRKKHLKGY